MSQPRIELSRRLAPMNCAARAEIASEAGISARQIGNVIVGQPVGTVAVLRLCAVTGIDPLPEIEHQSISPGDFQFGFFALGFAIRRRLNNEDVRECARTIGVGPATILRIERGDVMSIGVVLKACRYIKIHPFAYVIHPERIGVRENVSREIVNQQSNKQEPESVAATVG